MSRPFDPIKAQREITTGLIGVHRTLAACRRAAERRMTESEAEFDALSKLESFALQACADARDKLKQLETEARAQAQMGSPP